MGRVTDLNSLPMSPKRLAKAANEAGWEWRANYESVTADERSEFWTPGTVIDSLMVSCRLSPGLGYEGLWESIDGGKLALYTVRKYVPGEWSVRVTLNEAIADINNHGGN